MNMQTQQQRRGFTLVEVLVATSVVTIAVAIALGGFIYMLKNSNITQAQNELDTQVQVAMEGLKYHMRLSSLDEMCFYPAGASSSEAISMPLARDDDGDGAVDTDGEGAIIWDKTLVYHIWSTYPWQLRLTTFDPRDNSLSDAQRQAQLNSVVINGHGTATHNGSNATTKVVFENLFEWSITPRASSFDGYAPTLSREINEVLGGTVLTGGTHDIKFTIKGQNSLSTGYRMGVDNLFLSPSYSRREGEAQLPAVQQDGAVPSAQLMTTLGSWDGNYQLLFPATAAGNSFTLRMANDRWEETNFDGMGTGFEDTEVDFDTTLSPQDFITRLKGYGYSWYAYEQTGCTNAIGDPLATGYADTGDSVRGCAVRVLIRGSEVENGNWIRYSGGKSWVWIQNGGASSGEKLKINQASIAECASTNSILPDAEPGTHHRLVQWSSGVMPIELTAGSGIWMYHDLADFPIDREKNYLVTLLIDNAAAFGYARYWEEENDPSGRGCWVIPGGVPADVTDSAWSVRGDVTVTNRLYAVKYIYTSYPTNGVFTSQVFDTQLEAPTYTTIGWESVVPWGTWLGLRVRSGSSNDLSDASAWTSISPMTTPGSISPGNGRYVQFQAQMRPSSSGWDTPKLRSVTVNWEGETRAVDVGGTFTKGPNYGVFEVTVDGRPLTTGINVSLQIFKDVLGFRGTRRIISSLATEVVPRNTGR